MVERETLNAYLNQLLEIETVPDYAPNGLQVEGCAEIHTLITGVTACQALLDAAIEQEADAIIVHHGYFWKNESSCILGPKKRRLQTLLKHDVNLFAYHLPLDLHQEYGNNVQLAKRLGWVWESTFDVTDGLPLGFLGKLLEPQGLHDFSSTLENKLQRTPLVIAGGEHAVHQLAWCSGAAQDFLELAAHQKADTFLTGEVAERTVHIAREMGVHFIAAGHHATERYGVVALGDHLAERFSLQHQFIDIDNPV